jgi:hypothetical protein
VGWRSISSSAEGRAARFGLSWRAPFWGQKGVKSGVGKAWISLDSLVRIETFQWVTCDSLRKFFHARPWVVKPS